MPNPTFKAGGKVYKHNIPNEKVFGGKRFYLATSGSKKFCEKIAKLEKSKGNFVRIIKTPNGYEDAKKHPYGLYLRLRHWDNSDL